MALFRYGQYKGHAWEREVRWRGWLTRRIGYWNRYTRILGSRFHGYVGHPVNIGPVDENQLARTFVQGALHHL